MELGQSIAVKAKVERISINPREKSRSHERYYRVTFSKPRNAVWVGKRSIHVEGYTAYDSDEGYYFVPKKTVGVNLVALSKSQLAYVMDEDITESPDTQ